MFKKEMTLTQQESAAISHIRVLAMLSIILCHFLQALNNNYAWLFNIGVQIFLVMSGYLYGNKEIESWSKWYKKRFLRIYVPFILFFIAVLPLYACNQLITLKKVAVYLFDLQGVVGGGKRDRTSLVPNSYSTLLYSDPSSTINVKI